MKFYGKIGIIVLLVIILNIFLVSGNSKPKIELIEITDLKTYSELKEFVEKNQIDQKEWIKGEYMCKNFSRDFINEINKKGFSCEFYIIENHAQVICKVIEGNFIIEPQTDKIFKFFTY